MTKRGAPKTPSGAHRPAGPQDPPGPVFPMHQHIGRQLEAMFDELVTQPVPERFRQLLDELERKRSKI